VNKKLEPKLDIILNEIQVPSRTVQLVMSLCRLQYSLQHCDDLFIFQGRVGAVNCGDRRFDIYQQGQVSIIVPIRALVIELLIAGIQLLQSFEPVFYPSVFIPNILEDRLGALVPEKRIQAVDLTPFYSGGH
jgi:hypothetical protein